MKKSNFTEKLNFTIIIKRDIVFLIKFIQKKSERSDL